jgi:malonyl-CoA O-methyltransferase
MESIYFDAHPPVLMTADHPPTLDPVAAARWAQLAPVRPATSPWLHEEVARRMAERLEWIRLQPGSWAHWEPVRGGLQAQARLMQRYPGSTCFLVEASPARAQAARHSVTPPWWSPARWKASALRLETPPGQGVQMVWANMLLHHAADPQALLAEWHRALAVDGFVMFSCFGPDTLRELRNVYAALGWPAPAHEFTDMHDWGDMLVQGGFAEPVMDMERITLTFETPARLLQELRELGRNLHRDRFVGLRGRAWHAQLLEALATRLAQPAGGGRLSLSFEIIYGHALKAAPRLKVQARSEVTLDEMRAALRQHKKNSPAV